MSIEQSADLQAALKDLLDREEIRSLPQRYCHTIWEKDVDAYLELFTDDGALVSEGSELPQARGQAALREVLGPAIDALQPRPFIHNHVITHLEHDRAEGVCYAEIYMLEDGEPVLTTIRYDDEYARLSTGWRFRTRTMAVKSTLKLHH